MRPENRVSLAGAVVGVAYGIAARWLFGLRELETAFGVMSIAFLFGVPLVIGILTVSLGTGKTQQSVLLWFIAPWWPALATLAAALALVWEGIICIFLWLPVVMIMSSLGGVLAGIALRASGRSRPGSLVLCSVAVLPFLAAPFEHQFPATEEVRTITTHIRVAAPPAIVWNHIAQVSAIAPEELPFSIAHTIGFPRPIEATLHGTGVGAVRHATFDGGILFIETITAWKQDDLLSFTVRAMTDSIPPITLDEHVTVGGPYFDVLQGTYRIEPHADGSCTLILSSTHRISTRFNGYARIWTDFLMGNIQATILTVIQRRCDVQSMVAGRLHQ